MVAKRMANIPESGTVRITNIVSDLKAQGIDVISFSVGEPDFNTPDNITEAAVQSLRDHFTHYTASAGIIELRKAGAEKSRKSVRILGHDMEVTYRNPGRRKVKREK